MYQESRNIFRKIISTQVAIGVASHAWKRTANTARNAVPRRRCFTDKHCQKLHVCTETARDIEMLEKRD